MTYTRDPGLDDRFAPDEPPYRSRGEAQVGRFLDRCGLTFLYEQPTLIHDRGRHRIWRPDFTLPDHRGLIIEYAGMMDIPDYAAGIRHKQRAYARNGIPAMFIYPTDITRPAWPERLARRLYRELEPKSGFPAKSGNSPRAVSRWSHG